MKSQEKLNEPVIGLTTLKWTAPEIKILDSENTQLGFGALHDFGTDAASNSVS